MYVITMYDKPISITDDYAVAEAAAKLSYDIKIYSVPAWPTVTYWGDIQPLKFKD